MSKLTKKQIAEQEEQLQAKRLEQKNINEANATIIKGLNDVYGVHLESIANYIKNVTGLKVKIKMAILDYHIKEISEKDTCKKGFEVIFVDYPSGYNVNIFTKYFHYEYLPVREGQVIEKMESEKLPIEQAIFRCMFENMVFQNQPDGTIHVGGMNQHIGDVNCGEKFAEILTCESGVLFGKNYVIENGTLFECYGDNEKMSILDIDDLRNVKLHQDSMMLLTDKLNFTLSAGGVKEVNIEEGDICNCNICKYSKKMGWR